MIARICTIAFLAIGIAGCSALTEDVPMAREISTTGGKLTGITSEYNDTIRVFRGIPYAAPPVGDLRWRAPQPAASWTGVHEANTFSASCYQEQHTSGFVWRREDFAVSEDCLYLNIWSPENAEDLPVMVWFHGGAHTSGQGHSTIFDGTRIASENIVLVTINYRLGPFGFLAHDWLADESDSNSAGNYGLMDKIAALQWVQQNISAFGGNADNVTIFGQSAGSQSVCSLMASASARGLFHRAIGQSAACFSPLSNRDLDGRERGGKLAETLGADDLAAMRRADAASVLKAASESGWANMSRIVVDGNVLTETQQATFARGAAADVPLLLGCLSDEGVELFPKNTAMTSTELDAYLARMFGEDAGALRTLYEKDDATPGDIQHAIATDLFMAFGMRRWAEYSSLSGNDTWLYFMDHVPPAFHLYMPESPVLELPGGPRSGGAYHSGDLAYVFGTVDKVGVDWRDDDRALSETMVKYWTSFARTGNPNADGLATWQAFTADALAVQLLNATPETTSGVRNDALSLFAKTFPR